MDRMMKELPMDGTGSGDEDKMMPVATITLDIFEDGTYQISQSGGDTGGMGDEGGEMEGKPEMSESQSAPDFASAMRIIKTMNEAAVGGNAQEAFDNAGTQPATMKKPMKGVV